MLARLQEWLSDPPPSLIFEISEAGVSLGRVGPRARLPETLFFSALAEGAVEPTPIRENVRNQEELARAVAETLKQAGAIRKKDAALLLPDNCARLTVLDFENLPGDARERGSLIRWRLKKAVPFDVDTARLSYQVQRGEGAGAQAISVLVAVSPAEVIAQYEAALSGVGLIPGYVSISVAAALNLVVEHGVTLLVKLNGRVLSLVVIDQGRARLVRTLEAGGSTAALTEDRLREMAADLYPTFVYVTDNFGAPVSHLALAGFGDAFPLAVEVFRRELGYGAEALHGPRGPVDAYSGGLWGFLSGYH